MSNAKFRTIIVTIIAIVVALAIIVSETAFRYAASLDWALGRGERHIQKVGDVSEEDITFYDSEYDSAQESQAAAAELVKDIVGEGAVLLKNENNVLPLASGSNVTTFGYRFLEPFYGGSGSAKTDTSADYIVTPEKALSEFYSVNDKVVAKMKSVEPQVMVYDDGNDETNQAEFNPAIYSSVADTCNGTTGIVFIGRPAAEGFDYNSVAAYEDGTETQMEITENERNTIAFAKEHCDNVVVIVNATTPIELVEIQNDPEIDGILWVGLPGATGFYSMAAILAGEINPSGKLPDLWYADFKSDPTYVNRKSTAYTNAMEDGPSCYIEYAEGIYVGYRYYETRFAEDNSFPVFGETKPYEDAVVYPFGYGLHYENDAITQTLNEVKDNGETITVKGTISNTSSRDVKEVVQVYFGAPYTLGGIEKSAKELVAFTKVEVLAGQSKEVTLEFDKEDMASYDYKKIYSENGSYVLEKGDYEIFLGKNSHESWGSEKVAVEETLVYANDAKSGKAVGKRANDEVVAENLLNDMNDYVDSGNMTVMSRSDFAGTFPKQPEEKEMTERVLADVQKFDYKTDAELGEVEGSILYKTEDPTEKADNGLQLSSLRGLAYDDPRWDELLDNLDYSSADIAEVITHGLYRTAAIEAVGKVETADHDGTLGLTATWGGNNELAAMFGLTSNPVEAACSYPSESVQAATWNTELISELGSMIGKESLTNGVNGWYAPGLNLHRTPYGGRNFEYYSEDPVLTGYISAAVISGAFNDGGLTAYLKHFALNETDDNRSSVAIWANEQVARQLYFKAFELCVKNGKGTEVYYNSETGKKETIEVDACRALMTSMNYIGAESPTNSYTLLTKMLRNEWGFTGMVLTDFTSGTYKNPAIGYRLGNDIWMGMSVTELDMSTPTAKWAARNAIHNICYVVVNGNAYNQVAPGSYAYYDMSPWMKGLIGADVIVGILCVAGIVWIVIRQKKHKDSVSA